MNKTKDEKRECSICHEECYAYDTFQTIEGIMCKECLDQEIKDIQKTDEFSLDYLISVKEKYLDYCIDNLEGDEDNQLQEYLVESLLKCQLLKEINQEFLDDKEFYDYIKARIVQ